MSKTPHPYELLPFVHTFPATKVGKAERAKWEKRGGCGRDFWRVTPTGDQARDWATGEGFAWEALRTRVRIAGSGPPSIINFVVADMVRHGHFGGIEMGFMHMIAHLAEVPVRLIEGGHPGMFINVVLPTQTKLIRDI
jgi:hypothetical protein